MVYARVSAPKGVLFIKWGDDSASRCQLGYMLMPVSTEASSKTHLQRFDTPCQMVTFPHQSGNANTALANNR